MMTFLFGYSIIATLVIAVLMLERRTVRAVNSKFIEGLQLSLDRVKKRAAEADFLEVALTEMEGRVQQLENVAGHYEPIPKEIPRPFGDEDPNESGIRWGTARRPHASAERDVV